MGIGRSRAAISKQQTADSSQPCIACANELLPTHFAKYAKWMGHPLIRECR